MRRSVDATVAHGGVPFRLPSSLPRRVGQLPCQAPPASPSTSLICRARSAPGPAVQSTTMYSMIACTRNHKPTALSQERRFLSRQESDYCAKHKLQARYNRTAKTALINRGFVVCHCSSLGKAREGKFSGSAAFALERLFPQAATCTKYHTTHTRARTRTQFALPRQQQKKLS